MKNRYTLYGYQIRNGQFIEHPKEAEIVSETFLGAPAEKLCKQLQMTSLLVKLSIYPESSFGTRQE